jgi:hypothetical protein
MRVYDHNFPIPNTIAQGIRKSMSVDCGPLFVIDKMPCGMVSVHWCDIVLMALVSGVGKSGNKMSDCMNIWKGYLVSF